MTKRLTTNEKFQLKAKDTDLILIKPNATLNEPDENSSIVQASLTTVDINSWLTTNV